MSMLVIGECMMELRERDENTLFKSFAGDTYNSAVYAKRCFNDLQVQYLSALGTDPVSDEMLSQWTKWGVSSDYAVRIASLMPGIYSISTDDDGERSFSYWRKNSAASQLMSYLDTDKILANAKEFKLVFFTGITLAIMSKENRQALIELLQGLKSQGVKVAFDPNYRPHLWESKEGAIYWTELAYKTCDIILPGMDDHQDLFSHESAEDLMAYFDRFSATEIVVKAGSNGVYGLTKTAGDELQIACHVPFNPAPAQVDTTAAGDSFAGTFLAARIKEHSLLKSIEFACNVSREVVQHPGAIIEASLPTIE